MKHLKSLRFAAHMLLLLLLAASLHATTVSTKYVILFDVDNSTATGCTYTVGTTSISGIEDVLTTTVDRNGSSATVSRVERQQCSGGTLTTPPTLVDSTGWPATIGSDKTLHIVTYIPNSAFGTTVPPNMRLYIGVIEGTGATFIKTSADGSPILYPTIGPRHRAVVHDGTPVEPVQPVLDGTFSMFNGLPPMFLGPPIVTGTPQQLISSVFGLSGLTDIYFLINIGGNITGSLMAIDDSYTLQQGHGMGAGAPGVLSNDINTTGSPMLAQLLTSTHLGTLTLHADGSFHYDNNGAPQTVDTFTYKATAGGQSSDPATVTFHILPDNAPVGVADSYSVAHGGTLNVPPPGVLSNDTDADHDPITAVINTLPAHASSFHLNSNGSFTYTHDGSNTLSDTFTYRATDGIIPSFAVTVTITIGPDAPPVAVGDSYTITEGGTLSVPAPGLFANDSDPDTPQSLWTVQIVTPPAHGTLTPGAGGAFTYVHDDSGVAPDSFTYKVSDGILTSNTVTVSITITCPTITVTNPSTTTGTAATPFSQTFTQSGANATKVFSTTSTLPTGLTLSAAGVLSGTPTQTGSFPIVVKVAETSGCFGTSATYTLVIGCQNINVINPATSTGVAAAAFSQTFTQSGAIGATTFSTASALPTGLTLSSAGVLSGTPTQTGSFPIVVTVTDSNGCVGTGATYTLVITCQTINVTNPATTTGTANAAFSQTFTQSGSIGAATFSTASALPAGLALSTGGVLSGTPLVTGSFPIVVTATDSNGCTGSGATYTLVIGCQTISVTNPSTTTGTAASAFSQTFTAGNTIGTVTFTTASTLPTGLTLATNGTLSGTPTQTGSFPIVVTATDANGCSGTGATYTLVIGCQTITVTKPSNTTGTVSSLFSEQFTQSGAIGTATFTTASTLPNGLSLSSAGLLSGTPTQIGTFPITVTVTDSNSCTGTSATYTLVINCQVITVNNPSSSSDPAGTALPAANFTFTQSGAVGGATFTTASTLPTGVTLTTGGVLTGTPTQGGTFPIVVTVTDGNGCTGTNATYNLTIVCPVITVTNPATTTGTVNIAFSQTFTQSGGIGATTFSTVSTLPTGLSLSSGGVLSGTPTQTGSFPIVVVATDSNGCTGSGSTYTLVIGCQVIPVTNPVTNTGTVNVAFSQSFGASNTIGTVTFTTSSTLPAGLSLATNGTLSGTPTQTGTFPIVVTATDANSCSGNSSTYSLTIGCQVISVTNPATTTGTAASAFSQTFTAGNTIGTVTFTTASTLPTGLTLATNGTLSGTPTQTGTFPIVVTATDANSCSGSGSTYTLVIGCQTINVTNPANTTGTVSSLFSEQFTQSGAIGTATFTTASTLPNGVTLSTSGLLSGTPTQNGTFPIVVTVTDSNNCTGTSATYTLVINCQVITVNNPSSNSDAAGTALTAANFTFTQSGAVGGATFTTASTLPTGVTLTTGGVLTGTPMQGGSFPITVTVTDGNGCTGTSSGYTLTITCPVITVTNPATSSGTVNIAFSQTFNQSGGVGTTTFSTASTLPTGLTLNSSTGVLSGTPTQSGPFPIVVTATDSNGCTGSGPTYNLVIACQVITVTNPATTTGTVDAAFSQTFTSSNTIGTVSYTTSSPLPAGLTLSTGGVLSGTPTVPGSFPIVVTATDANGCSGNSSSYPLVISCQTITVTNPVTNSGTVDAAFSQTFTQSAAHGTATFTTASTLPAGLSLSTAGVLSGTPTVKGTFPIVVTVTDSNNCTGTSSTYTLTINCQTITVTKPVVNSGTVNAGFSQTFTQSGAHATATFTTASTLPNGLTLSTGGVLSGTPTQPGTFPIVVTVTDANGCTGTSSTYTLVIACQTISVTNPATTTGTVASAFSQTFNQSGGFGTTNFTTASTLPTGLTLHAATGVLDGTPTQSGTFPIVVRATDSNGCFGDGATYTLVIACNVISVTNPSTTTGTAGTLFSQTFTQSGGNGTITWSETGALPPGITLNTSNGLLSGTTSTTGSFPITVTATDANGCQGTGSTYTLVISCQTISITNPTSTSVQAGSSLTPASNWTFSASGILGTANWTITSGTLPTGITLNSSTGVLSGSTNQLGPFTITVKVTDTNLCFSTSSYTLTVTCPTITVTRTGGGSFPVGTFNSAYTGQSVTASGGSGTYTFAVTAGALPTGLSLSSGAISGTPTKTGTFSFTITATDTATSCTGSQSFTIAIKPVHSDDSYSNLVNNTEAVITGGATSSPATPFVTLTGTIISNDFPTGGVAAVGGTFSTTQGGSVTIASDGTFKYTPPVTVSALSSDTFTYTLSSDTGATGTATTDTGTVTLNLSNRVWYVKNNGSAGNGQSQSPFNTLAAAQTPSTANDIIYVYNGDGTTTGQTAGITLKSGQQLIGQGVALVVNANTLVAAGTKPQITNTAATSDAVTLNDGNTVKGVTITGATRDGIAGSTHAGFTGDTLTIQNNTSSGLHLTSMTGTVTVTNATLSGSATQLDINNGTAAITLDNTNTITAAAGKRSVSIQNRPGSAGAIAIGASITDSGTGILVNANTSGTISFTGTQTMSTTTNTAVALTTNTGTTINFSGTLGITTTTGTGFTATGGGTLNVTGTANVTTGAATNGVNINGVTVGASGATFASITTNGATTGVSLTSIGNGNVNINGGNIDGGTTGISLNTLGTSTVTLAGLTIGGTTRPTTAISGTTFGTLAISGASVSVKGVTALSLNTGVVSGTFNTVDANGGANGVTLTGVTGSWGATNGTLTGATAAEFLVSGGGSGTITWGPAITQANASTVVSILSSNSNTINFSGAVTSSTLSTGLSITASSGTYNFNGTNAFTGAGGILISNGESGTVTFSSNTTNTATGTSFQIDGSVSAVTAAITYSGTINKTSAGRMIDVNKLNSPGTLTMTHSPAAAGNLTAGTSGAATGISIINSSSTNITIANASVTVNNSAAAFTSSGNTGTINLQGIAFVPGGNKVGMLISGGGTINVTDGAASSTINASTGTASAIDGTTAAYTGTLNLTNATITSNAAGGVFLTSSTLGGTGSTITGTGSGLTLSGVTLTSAAGMASISSSGGANGISLTNVVHDGTNGTYTVAGGTISGNSGSSFLVSGGTQNFTYNGTLAQTSAQRIVNVSGITAGTITLGAGITGTTSCTGITLGGSGGTVTISGLISLNGASDTFSSSTSGLTINATNANNVIGNTSAPTGPALSVSNATIGSGNLLFKSISANGGANGIVLSSTGASGSLTVAGDGTTTRNSTGGTLQNLTNNGISLTSTLSPSFSHMLIQFTTHSGVKGTTTTNFTFQHGQITNSGIDSTSTVVGTTDDSNIAFNTTVAGTETNLTGVVTIKNNALSNAYYRGIDIYNFAGNVSDGHIESNTITSIADTTKSKGAGIRWVTEKNATVTKNNIDSNGVNNFPTDVAIDVPCGTAGFLSGHTDVCGSFNATPNTGPNIINITNNTILGSGAALPVGAEGIVSYCNTCNLNLNVSGNSITNVKGTGISSSAFGKASVSAYINNNTLVTHNQFAAAGIGVGTSFSSAAGAAEDPIYNTIISNNTISQNDGNDILAVARDVNGTLKAKIFSNNASAPLTGARPGIRVDSGNSNGNDTVCMNMFSNTTAGSGSVAGIGMRRQSTNVNVFGVEGMAATSSPNVEAFVGNGGGKNPGTVNGVGDGSFNGVLLLSATTGFSNCSNGF